MSAHCHCICQEVGICNYYMGNSTMAMICNPAFYLEQHDLFVRYLEEVMSLLLKNTSFVAMINTD